jgi:hypothetical protein
MTLLAIEKVRRPALGRSSWDLCFTRRAQPRFVTQGPFCRALRIVVDAEVGSLLVGTFVFKIKIHSRCYACAHSTLAGGVNRFALGHNCAERHVPFVVRK